MTNDDRELFQSALDEWGAEAQVGMLHEEIGELLTVLNKIRRELSGASWSALRGNALEEIEDVRIMLDQMVVMFKSPDEHQADLRNHKIGRLRDLIQMQRNYEARQQDGFSRGPATATVTGRVKR